MKLAALGLLVFVCEVVADFAWARYTINVAARKPYHAGMWSGVIQLLATVTIFSFIESYWVALPAIAGSYVGTVWAVKHEGE